MAKKILIISTSHEKLGDTDEKTGLWYEELAAPYYVFKNAGYAVDLASIKGGHIPIDATSLSPPFKTAEVETFLADASNVALVENSIPLDSIESSVEYAAIFLPGGHGTAYDFPGNAKLASLLSEAYAAGKVVSAVCHGPNGLVDAKQPDGRPLVAGKKVAGFTNSEEAAVGKTEVVPFLLEDKLKELGGLYERAEDWASFAVADGNLVTGQNPGSSTKTAELVVAALS